jgi:hypothetical protein
MQDTQCLNNEKTEGFYQLMDQTITIFCAVYIYTGELIGVQVDSVLLKNPKIVYETGAFETKDWKDAQALPHNMYIMKSMIESYGIVK